MTNLLITTPDYLLRYDARTKKVFVVEDNRREYYGISWFKNDSHVYLSHSGLDNAALETVTDYIMSEVGWLSHGRDSSWPFLSQPHQILCLEEDLIAVANTGRNCLTLVNPRDWSIRNYRFDGVLWDRLGSSERQGSHFNSLTVMGEFLFVLAHNFNKGSYILRLEQPSLRLVEVRHYESTGLHNIWYRDDGLSIACDTMNDGLISLGDGRILWRSHDPCGLSRGLAATGDKIYVGASINQDRSSRRTGETGIWAIDAGHFKTHDYHALGRFGGVHEVRVADEHDLCHPQGALPIAPELLGVAPGTFFANRKLRYVSTWERWERVVGYPVSDTDSHQFMDGGLCIAVRRQCDISSFKVSAVIDVSAGYGDQNCAIIGRYQGPGDTNMVAAIVTLDTRGHPTLGLWRENGTGWMCLISRPLRRPLVAVEMTGDGNRFVVHCDGAEMLVAEDDTIPASGKVGVRALSGKIQEFRLERL